MDQWIPGITRVEVDRNQHRVCTFANGAVQHETILDYSSETRSYRYLIEVSPLPVKNNRGRFAVVTDGPGSVIDWESEFEALDPADEAHISQMWREAAKGVLEALKRLVESA